AHGLSTFGTLHQLIRQLRCHFEHLSAARALDFENGQELPPQGGCEMVICRARADESGGQAHCVLAVGVVQAERTLRDRVRHATRPNTGEGPWVRLSSWHGTNGVAHRCARWARNDANAK